MSYHVAAANGVTAAGVSVKFILGKAWSVSNAHVSVGGVTASGAEAWNGNNQATVTGVTDANGDVSFTLVNTDTTITGKVFTQTAAYVTNAGVDTIDIVDVIFDAPATPTASATPTETATAAPSETATASATPTGPVIPSSVKIRLTSTNTAGPAGIVGNGWWHGNNTVFTRLVGQTATIIILGNKYNSAIYKGKDIAAVFTGKEDTTSLVE
jgi:hypothetical protein